MAKAPDCAAKAKSIEKKLTDQKKYLKNMTTGAEAIETFAGNLTSKVKIIATDYAKHCDLTIAVIEQCQKAYQEAAAAEDKLFKAEAKGMRTDKDRDALTKLKKDYDAKLKAAQKAEKLIDTRQKDAAPLWVRYDEMRKAVRAFPK